MGRNATPGQSVISRRRPPAIDSYLKARRSDMTQRGERVTDHTTSKELAVLRSALQRAKRLGKFFGDLDAVFPSTGEYAPGYDPRKSGAKALSREDVARLFAAASCEPKAAIFAANPVRGDGIEPPTRGFAIPADVTAQRSTADRSPDAVEGAVARTMTLAAEAGQWALVGHLARELEARRLARAGGAL